MTRCGEYLAHCRCSGTTPRTADEIKAAHRQAVRRAKAHGWDTAQARRRAVVALLPPVPAAEQAA